MNVCWYLEESYRRSLIKIRVLVFLTSSEHRAYFCTYLGKIIACEVHVKIFKWYSNEFQVKCWGFFSPELHMYFTITIFYLKFTFMWRWIIWNSNAKWQFMWNKFHDYLICRNFVCICIQISGEVIPQVSTKPQTNKQTNKSTFHSCSAIFSCPWICFCQVLANVWRKKNHNVTYTSLTKTVSLWLLCESELLKTI